MAPPGPECTCGWFEKHMLWLNRDIACDNGARLTGKVTGTAQFAIRSRADIIVRLENCLSFLDIYDLVWPHRELGAAAKRPGSGYER
jgi:hypothetical protein